MRSTARMISAVAARLSRRRSIVVGPTWLGSPVTMSWKYRACTVPVTMPMSVPVASRIGPCSICASSQQDQPRGDGVSAPDWPAVRTASRTLMPSSSVMASASSNSRSAAWTRLPIIAGRKRLPYSLIQLTSSSGLRVRTPDSASARITSSPASTPNTPSKRPPVGTGRDGCRRRPPARYRRCLGDAETYCR